MRFDDRLHKQKAVSDFGGYSLVALFERGILT